MPSVLPAEERRCGGTRRAWRGREGEVWEDCTVQRIALDEKTPIRSGTGTHGRATQQLFFPSHFRGESSVGCPPPPGEGRSSGKSPLKGQEGPKKDVKNAGRSGNVIENEAVIGIGRCKSGGKFNEIALFSRKK